MPKKGKGRTSRKRGKGQFKAGKEGEERNVEENPGKKALAAGKSGEGKGGEMREIREREKKKLREGNPGSVGWWNERGNSG